MVSTLNAYFFISLHGVIEEFQDDNPIFFSTFIDIISFNEPLNYVSVILSEDSEKIVVL